MALRYRKTVVEAVIEMSNSMAAEAAQRAFIERLLVQERAVRATGISLCPVTKRA